jgi:hypothetical protein
MKHKERDEVKPDPKLSGSQVGNSDAEVAKAKPGDWIVRKDGTKYQLNQGDIEAASKKVGGSSPITEETTIPEPTQDNTPSSASEGEVEEKARANASTTSKPAPGIPSYSEAMTKNPKLSGGGGSSIPSISEETVKKVEDISNDPSIQKSLNKVMGVKEDESASFWQNLALFVAAFGAGYTGKQSQIVQAALEDFKAERDSQRRTLRKSRLVLILMFQKTVKVLIHR